jgi:hypothetical protein
MAASRFIWSDMESATAIVAMNRFPAFFLFERCAQASSLRAASFAWLR